MLKYLFRLLGLTPEEAGKTGKREAAWTVFGINVAMTFFIIEKGVEMVGACIPILMVTWPSAIALVGAAYKLEHDLDKLRTFSGTASTGVDMDYKEQPYDEPGNGSAG